MIGPLPPQKWLQTQLLSQPFCLCIIEVMSEKTKEVPQLADATYAHTLIIFIDSFTMQTLIIHCTLKFFDLFGFSQTLPLNLPNRLWGLLGPQRSKIVAVLSCGGPTDIWGLKRSHNLLSAGFLTTR